MTSSGAKPDYVGLQRRIIGQVHGTEGNAGQILEELERLTTVELTEFLTHLHGDPLAHVRETAAALLHQRLTRESNDHMTALSGSITSLMKEIDDSGRKVQNAAKRLGWIAVGVAVVDVVVGIASCQRR